jgi:hypothetical protein
MGSHHSTRAETTTWLTPHFVHEALGAFDLDPCAAPNWPTARRHIIQPDCGMMTGWHGRVWLNPPYKAKKDEPCPGMCPPGTHGNDAWDWLDKLAAHGRGTALIFARTETAGFVSQVWEKATAVKFLHGRLHFHRPDGTRASANAGAPSVLVAYGLADAHALEASSLPGTYLRLGARL